MMPDFRVPIGWDTADYIVHDIAQRLGQLMGLAQAQHLGQIALGVYIQQQDFLALHPPQFLWHFGGAAG